MGNKYIGRKFTYLTDNGETRIGTCIGIYFNPLTNKWMFEAVSPYGNAFQLPKDKIMFNKS